MAKITKKQVHDAIVELIATCSTILPKDAYKALEDGMAREENPAAKEVFRQLINNADYAKEQKLPLCQDTGTGIFFVERGENFQLEDGMLNEVINNAMIEAYEKSYLRKSMCDPFTRQNTKDNSPAVIHTEMVAGDGLKISFLAKGGGSENMSRCTMLSPSQGIEGIKDFIITRVAEAGPNPCPPIVVGVGIGGTFETAPILAKKALMRDLDDTNPDATLAKLEEELLSALNKLNIGPMGLGGKTSAFAVKIKSAPCHIASLPLAVNIQCHSIRHGEVEFK